MSINQEPFYFDPEADFAPERWMGRLSRGYERSYTQGRGIKRLTCFLVGLIPYWAAILALCIVSLLVILGYWLFLPKEQFAAKTEKHGW